jgi:hypothetical protein
MAEKKASLGDYIEKEEDRVEVNVRKFAAEEKKRKNRDNLLHNFTDNQYRIDYHDLIAMSELELITREDALEYKKAYDLMSESAKATDQDLENVLVYTYGCAIGGAIFGFPMGGLIGSIYASIFYNNNLEVQSQITLYSAIIGTIILPIILGFALANKFKKEKKEKQEQKISFNAKQERYENYKEILKKVAITNIRDIKIPKKLLEEVDFQYSDLPHRLKRAEDHFKHYTKAVKSVTSVV